MLFFYLLEALWFLILAAENEPDEDHEVGPPGELP